MPTRHISLESQGTRANLEKYQKVLRMRPGQTKKRTSYYSLNQFLNMEDRKNEIRNLNKSQCFVQSWPMF